jgi:lipopolysaccharide transport system ATP-binding protein
MSEPMVVVESVSKRYQRGMLGSRGLLSERIGHALRSPLQRRAQPLNESSAELFWALRDVSLEIAEGEVVGIIGRNGAGKSTLLKLLSRITPPTEGRISLYGRVASLLEVGTGFHPELTGRENVYLNGAILGMRRREIERRFDEIVDFSGVGAFLDTPVKRYSSGMYVRLGFAVAAHLDPEILLVDEVLAVGDTEFQRKCLGKMQDASAAGRTVVFISHNLVSLRRLCPRTYWLDEGRVILEGPSDAVVRRYLQDTDAGGHEGDVAVDDDAPRMGSGHARFTRVSLLGPDGRPATTLHLGEPIRVAIGFEVARPLEQAVIEVGITSQDGERIATVQNVDFGRDPVGLDRGAHKATVEIDSGMLPGAFAIDVAIHDVSGVTADFLQRIIRFTTLNASADGGDYYRWPVVRGYARPRSRWSFGADAPRRPALGVDMGANGPGASENHG